MSSGWEEVGLGLTLRSAWLWCQPPFPGYLSSSHRFLVYGRYCSQVESASKHLDRVATAREDVQMKLEVGAGLHLRVGGLSHSFPGSGDRREETVLEMASLSIAALPGVCPLKVWGWR